MAMPDEIMVRSGVLAGAPELVRELGGDPAEVARRAGIGRRALGNPDTPISGVAVLAYLNFAAEHCASANFGLQLGPRQSLSLFGHLAPLLESAATIGELIRDISAYFPLHTRATLVSLVPEHDGIALCYDAAAGVSETRRQVIELGMSIMVHELRRHCPDWEPQDLCFRHGPGPSLAPYRRFLRCSPQFNADRNALFLPRELLARSTLGADPGRHGELEAGFDAARRELAAAADRAEIVVRALLPFAPCDLAATARLMRVSRRTLQRRLGASGDSFEKVVDRVRADLAWSYLVDSDLSVAQIAEILQFSETSALSRACRRWHGQSPRGLRKAA